MGSEMWSQQGQRTTRDREGGGGGEFLVPVPAPSLWWLHEELPAWICVPVGTVLSHSQALCAGLTHKGRFPLQLQQPWDEAQSQLTQRECRRARPWRQMGTEQLCPKAGLTASQRGAGGSTYTSPEPCLRGGKCVSQGRSCFHGSTSPTTQLCLKCLAQLTRGSQRRQLRQLLPTLRANIPIKWPTKYFLSFL